MKTLKKFTLENFILENFHHSSILPEFDPISPEIHFPKSFSYLFISVKNVNNKYLVMNSSVPATSAFLLHGVPLGSVFSLMMHEARVWCDLVQRGAMWWSDVQIGAAWCKMVKRYAIRCWVTRFSAGWCNVFKGLQCGEECTVWCKVMQFGEAWSSVMQCGTKWHLLHLLLNLYLFSVIFISMYILHVGYINMGDEYFF